MQHIEDEILKLKENYVKVVDRCKQLNDEKKQLLKSNLDLKKKKKIVQKLYANVTIKKAENTITQ